jgi:tumor protein p53-inducible protein 3
MYCLHLRLHLHTYDTTTTVLAPDSKYIVYGTMSDTTKVELNLSVLMGKRIQLHGTTLRARSIDYKHDLVKNLVREIIPAFESKKVKPIVWKVYNWKDVRAAHTALENNLNIGKIILTIDP